MRPTAGSSIRRATDPTPISIAAKVFVEVIGLGHQHSGLNSCAVRAYGQACHGTAPGRIIVAGEVEAAQIGQEQNRGEMRRRQRGEHIPAIHT